MKTRTRTNMLTVATLAALGGATVPVQAAEPLKIGIIGNMQQWFGIVQHEKDAGQNFNTFGINTDNELAFSGTSTLDNGLEVTARMVLDAYNDNVGPGNNASSGVDEVWVSVGGAFGKLYAGAKESMNHSLHNQPDDYGIGYDNVGMWTIVPAAGFVAGRAPWMQTSFEKLADDVPMAGYISPKLAGVQLALTYSPNEGTPPSPLAVSGLGTQRVDRTARTGRTNYWDTTLAYGGEWGGVTLGSNVGYGAFQGTPQSVIAGVTPVSSGRAVNAGLKVGYGGFTVGGSWLRLMEPTKNDAVVIAFGGSAWNAGVAYATAAWGVSYTYYTENHQETPAGGNSKEKFQTHLISGKYSIGPGVDLKSSFLHGKFNGRDRSDDTHNTWAYALVSGIDVSF
ncbi:MAG: hypothetical protein FD149_853 [Rhodospirillaceae bacterium]|nr:MAG: hypothetical protein FD149_853 [Rhodospirillaceae bacterium]